jgi:hypothetical protein
VVFIPILLVLLPSWFLAKDPCRPHTLANLVWHWLSFDKTHLLSPSLFASTSSGIRFISYLGCPGLEFLWEIKATSCSWLEGQVSWEMSDGTTEVRTKTWYTKAKTWRHWNFSFLGNNMKTSMAFCHSTSFFLSLSSSLYFSIYTLCYQHLLPEYSHHSLTCAIFIIFIFSLSSLSRHWAYASYQPLILPWNCLEISFRFNQPWSYCSPIRSMLAETNLILALSSFPF